MDDFVERVRDNLQQWLIAANGAASTPGIRLPEALSIILAGQPPHDAGMSVLLMNHSSLIESSR